MRSGRPIGATPRGARAVASAVLVLALPGFGRAEMSDYLVDEAIQKPASARLRTSAERQAEAMARFVTGMFEEESAGPEEALDSYRRVLTLDPGFTRLAIDVAYDYLRRGESAEAIGVLKDALKANADQPAPALALSSIYLRHLRKPDLAAKYAEAAVKISPKAFGGYEALWEIAQAQGDSVAAAAALDRARKSGSEDPTFWISVAEFTASSVEGDPFLDSKVRASIREALSLAEKHAGEKAEDIVRIADFYLIHQQFEPAADLYVRAAKASPSLPKIREKLASTLIETGRMDEAVPVLEEIIRENPLDLAAYDQLRRLYIDREEYSKALACVEQSIIIDKKNSFLFNQLVRLLLTTGDYEGAVKRLEEARKLFPQNAEFTFLHARALALTDRFPQAVEAFGETLIQASSSQPDLLNSDFYLEYGMAAERAGFYVKADELLKKAIELNPTDPSIACNALGYMWVERGERLDEAEQLIRRALAIDPGNPAYVDSLGWLYYKKGRYEEALTELLKASKTIEEPDAVIYDHVADTYNALGRTAEAIIYWKKALQLDPKDEKIAAKLQGLADQTAQKAGQVPTPANPDISRTP